MVNVLSWVYNPRYAIIIPTDLIHHHMFSAVFATNIEADIC
jgi:hypothetical protein